METTKVIIEYVIAGILMIIAITFLFMSIFSVSFDAIGRVMTAIPSTDMASDIVSSFNNIITSIIFLSIAYSLGVISEYFGMISLERFIEGAKKNRFPKYIKGNEKDLYKSPLLKDLENKSEEEIKGQALYLYGQMRFHVMDVSETLYNEILDQLNRVRLSRVLLWVEVIVIISLVIQLKTSYYRMDVVIALLITFVILLILTFSFIRKRFARYCRSIERSYKELVFCSDSLEGN